MNRYEFYQWDLDVTVPITDQADSVHLASVGTSHAYVVGITDGTFPVPNILLQKAKDILAWYVTDDKVTKEIHIIVHKRAKPDTYAYTPTEVKTVENMSQAMIDALETEIEKVDASLIKSVTVTSLPNGTEPTAAFENNTLSLGIPKGDPGEGGNVNITSLNNNLRVTKTDDGYTLESRGYRYNDYASSTVVGSAPYTSAPGKYAVAENGKEYQYGEKANDTWVFMPSDENHGNANLMVKNYPIAYGKSSHAGGYSGNANGASSFSFGERTFAQGDNSVAFGKFTTSLGYASTSLGVYNSDYATPYDPNNAYSKGDVVVFEKLNPQTQHSTVAYFQALEDIPKPDTKQTYKNGGVPQLGQWKEIKYEDSTNARVGYLLTVGNGTSTIKRSNALSLDWEGNLNVAGKVNGVDLSTIVTKEYLDEQLGVIANGSY